MNPIVNMKKAKFIITAETDLRLDNESQMELLAHIRNALRVVDNSYPEMKLTVSKLLDLDDVAQAIDEIRDDRTREQCMYYDEAQGKHKCTNEMVKSNKCNGVCKFYWNKKNLTG